MPDCNAKNNKKNLHDCNEYMNNDELRNTLKFSQLSRYANPYEKLKALTRGQKVTKEIMENFLESLDMPEEAKALLRGLTPATYIGRAIKFAKDI